MLQAPSPALPTLLKAKRSCLSFSLWGSWPWRRKRNFIILLDAGGGGRGRGGEAPPCRERSALLGSLCIQRGCSPCNSSSSCYTNPAAAAAATVTAVVLEGGIQGEGVQIGIPNNQSGGGIRRPDNGQGRERSAPTTAAPPAVPTPASSTLGMLASQALPPSLQHAGNCSPLQASKILGHTPILGNACKPGEVARHALPPAAST